VFGVTERRACRVIGQHRSTQRRCSRPRSDEKRLTADIVRLTSNYGRITALLRQEGWTVNAKRVERIWRCEGLKIPHRQPKRGRLWLAEFNLSFLEDAVQDGDCPRIIRLQAADEERAFESRQIGVTTRAVQNVALRSNEK